MEHTATWDTNKTFQLLRVDDLFLHPKMLAWTTAHDLARSQTFKVTQGDIFLAEYVTYLRCQESAIKIDQRQICLNCNQPFQKHGRDVLCATCCMEKRSLNCSAPLSSSQVAGLASSVSVSLPFTSVTIQADSRGPEPSNPTIQPTKSRSPREVQSPSSATTTQISSTVGSSWLESVPITTAKRQVRGRGACLTGPSGPMKTSEEDDAHPAPAAETKAPGKRERNDNVPNAVSSFCRSTKNSRKKCSIMTNTAEACSTSFDVDRPSPEKVDTFFPGYLTSFIRQLIGVQQSCCPACSARSPRCHRCEAYYGILVALFRDDQVKHGFCHRFCWVSGLSSTSTWELPSPFPPSCGGSLPKSPRHLASLGKHIWDLLNLCPQCKEKNQTCELCRGAVALQKLLVDEAENQLQEGQ
eukprot:gb/GECG01016376.1/.p1 GENE.gb/GECG01016376.1/~~gb/GECG01016376.1/.p1  ORF type:complete len:412 (+),score=25.95 gb/GECG01016376.1/:1-1236(+)